MWNPRPTFDDRDAEILATRAAALMKNPINVGDFVRFADGVTRRISYIWTDEHGAHLPNGIQTSAGGSYYLGSCYVSFSGALFNGVPFESLTDTGDTHDGDVWFFHHDYHTANNGVHCTAKFRVWTCSLPAERC